MLHKIVAGNLYIKTIGIKCETPHLQIKIGYINIETGFFTMKKAYTAYCTYYFVGTLG